MDAVQLVLSVAGLAVAIGALLFARSQIMQIKRSQFAERRPYVVPTFEYRPADKNSGRVYFVITNHGHTPAKNVILGFEAGKRWHDLASPSHLPFLAKNGGISVLPPNEPMKYFVGVMDAKSPLQKLRTSELRATVQFEMYEESKPVVDEFRLTLRDFSGAQSLPRKSRSGNVETE